jgi:curved DNA-binding protein CbpA
MGVGDVSEDDLERMPSLASNCDPTSLSLTSAEGYLLSRIDGHTTWRLLRDIGGLPPEDVDVCLESWLDQGVVCLRERVRPRAPSGAAAAQKPGLAGKSSDPCGIDQPRLDPSLDMDLETQRRILEFESRLERPYHEILGVAVAADAREIKRAYYELSKEFHPDCYFRREIGDFAGSLDRIFKAVLEAYQLLSDPTTRSEVQRNLVSPRQQAATPADGPCEGEQIPGSSAAASVPKPPLTPIERLRQRMLFKMPKAVQSERCQKAAQFFNAAQQSAKRGRFKEAISSVRLAVAFDPFNDEYKRTFAEIQAACSEELIGELIQNSDSAGVVNQQRKTLELCEEVLRGQPQNHEANHRAARMALELNDFAKAREYAERAVEHAPDVAEYHTTMGRIYKRLGNKGHAIRELEKLIELDPNDEEALKQLDLVKGRSPRTADHGGVQ